MRLVYFSPVAWDSYEQRPHYFVRHFLDAGGSEVVWVNPHAARLPRLADLGRLADPVRPLWLNRPAGLTVLDVRALPIDPLPTGAWLNERVFWRQALDRLARTGSKGDTLIGVGRPTALALATLKALPHARSFYDAMDMFPEFYRGLSRRFTASVEHAIASRVTQVMASSTAIADKFVRMGRPVTLIRNGYDMDLLPPVSVAATHRPPALGFLGCMGRWFDWELLTRLAAHVHPMPVHLVGPQPAPVPRVLPDNVQWQPECHQPDIVPHLETFSVGLIPFTRDSLTAGVDPIKYYQYRGAGLPVLTTRFGEMAHRSDDDDVFFLDEGDIGRATEAALAARPALDSIAAFRRENTWHERFSAANVVGSL